MRATLTDDEALDLIEGVVHTFRTRGQLDAEVFFTFGYEEVKNRHNGKKDGFITLSWMTVKSDFSRTAAAMAILRSRIEDLLEVDNLNSMGCEDAWEEDLYCGEIWEITFIPTIVPTTPLFVDSSTN